MVKCPAMSVVTTRLLNSVSVLVEDFRSGCESTVDPESTVFPATETAQPPTPQVGMTLSPYTRTICKQGRYRQHFMEWDAKLPYFRKGISWLVPDSLAKPRKHVTNTTATHALPYYNCSIECLLYYGTTCLCGIAYV